MTMNHGDARELLRQVWAGVGFSNMLRIMSLMINEDTGRLPVEPRFACERANKNFLCGVLNNAANEHDKNE